MSSRDDTGRQHLRVMPPAANWFNSQACDWGYDERNRRWLLVFGSKSDITIVEFNPTTPPGNGKINSTDQALRRPLATNFVAIMARAKTDGRVAAVRCMRDTNGELRVLCCADDGSVQIWDPVTYLRVDEHRDHNGVEVAAVGVRMDLDPNWIVAGDRQGNVSVWQRDVPSVQIFCPLPRDAIYTMDISPRDKTVVAVGYRSGALCVVDLANKNIQFRLDGHSAEVQSVAWAPLLKRPLSEAEDFLASSSRDRTIKVWGIPTSTGREDNRPEALASQAEVRQPQMSSSYTQSVRLWLPVAWYPTSARANKLALWSGSYEGNLVLWEWKNAPRGSLQQSRVASNGHHRIVFAIVFMDSTQAAEPGQEKIPSVFATISLDRDIRFWREPTNSSSKEIACIETLPGQGGYVNAVDFHYKRQLLACGMGDQSIKLWNLGAKPSAGGYSYEFAWRGLQSRISCVRWHPLQDHLVAFGTEDGRIGFWDMRTKNSQRLKLANSSDIRDLAWTVRSPTVNATASTGDSSFEEALHALEQAQAQGQSLEAAMATQRNGHSTGPNGETKVFLWVCTRSLALFRSDVGRDVSIQVRNDCHCIAWDSAGSVLAVGLSSGKIEILTETPDGSPTSSILKLRSALHDHKSTVNRVSWSEAGEASLLLAAGSTTGDIIVYEGVEQSPAPRRYSHVPGYSSSVVAVFRAHHCPINCLRWCAPGGKADLVASCADDGTVKVWDVASRAILSVFDLHVDRVVGIAWLSATALASGGQDQSIRLWDYRDHLVGDKPRGSGSAATKNPSSREAGAADPPKVVAPLPQATNDKMFEKKHPDWMISSVSRSQDGDDSEARTQNHSALDKEREQLIENHKWDEAARLYLLEGNIGEALKLVSRGNALTAEWVAYAPMAGQDVWREIANLYADKLKRSREYKLAALQYLSIGKVESAVGCFVEGSMFAEALSLILSRLGPTHALAQKAKWDYATDLQRKKKFQRAAKMFASVGSNEGLQRAISVLSSTGKLEDAAEAIALARELRKHTTESPDDRPTLASSVFLSIACLAIARGEFRLAMEAIEGLQASASEAQATLYRLSRIAVSVVSVFASADVYAPSLVALHGSRHDATDQFLATLSRPSELSWTELLPQASLPTETARRAFWRSALASCQENGLWHDVTPVLQPDEVVEPLGDATIFDYLLKHSSNVRVVESGPDVVEAMGLSRLVVKMLAELLSGYLVSALEAFRDLLSSLLSAGEPKPHVVSLLTPFGLLDPMRPPAFGEFGDEAADTQRLWAESFLLQCEIVLRLTSDDRAASLLPLVAPIQDLLASSSSASGDIKTHAQRVLEAVELARAT